MPHCDVVANQGGLGLAAAGHAVLGHVDNGIVLNVGLVPDLDGVDVTWVGVETKQNECDKRVMVSNTHVGTQKRTAMLQCCLAFRLC